MLLKTLYNKTSKIHISITATAFMNHAVTMTQLFVIPINIHNNSHYSLLFTLYRLQDTIIKEKKLSLSIVKFYHVPIIEFEVYLSKILLIFYSHSNKIENVFNILLLFVLPCSNFCKSFENTENIQHVWELI